MVRRMDFVWINGEGELVERPKGMLVDYAEYHKLKLAAEEVLRVYMPQFNDSRAVDDCLVGLAAAVSGIDCSTPSGETKP